MKRNTNRSIGQLLTDGRRMAVVLVLIACLELGIGAVNSVFHWHSTLPLYAVALLLLVAVALAILYARQAAVK